MVLGVIVFGSVWPTLLATVQGFATVEPRLKDVAQMLHLSRAAFIWKIGLPNAVPDIVAGMRLSLTVVADPGRGRRDAVRQGGPGHRHPARGARRFARPSSMPASPCSASSA